MPQTITNTETPFHEEVPLLPSTNFKDEASGSETSLIDTSESADKRDDIKSPTHSKAHYSIFVAICFSLNYSIGSGILGLPYEYYNAGFVLGSILLTYLGLLTYVTYTFVMDGMQRAEAITTLSKRFSITRHKLLNDPDYTKEVLSGTSVESLRESYSFTKNEYQLSELIGMFGGKWWKLGYDISYGISTLIALWSYSALFGISLARNIGIPGLSDACDMSLSVEERGEGCRGLYSLYVAIFWVWTVIVSLMDFTEQAGIQIFATAARICIICLMIFTSIGLIYSSWFYNGETYEWSPLTLGSYAEGTSGWKWSGMAYMIAVSAFAYGNQYCVTDIIEPLSMNDRKRKQHQLWAWSVGICAMVYVACGITISLYYGSNTESPCTLAWRGFMGFAFDSGQPPIWALIVSWFIVLFPAIDIGSAYPLNAVTLANTIEAAILPESMIHANKMEITMADEEGGGVRMMDENHAICAYEKRYSILFRVLVCTSTAILALIEWNFDLILGISGAFGLLAVYVGPVVLEWKSKQMMNEITNYADNNVAKTPTTKTWTSHRSWSIVIAGTALIAFIAVFVDIFETYL